MDLQKLKSIYDAARALNGHTLEDASVKVGKSQSMINQVLSGTATSQPTTDAIKDYCYKAGLESNIRKLGLDPQKKVKAVNA